LKNKGFCDLSSSDMVPVNKKNSTSRQKNEKNETPKVIARKNALPVSFEIYFVSNYIGRAFFFALALGVESFKLNK